MFDFYKENLPYLILFIIGVFIGLIFGVLCVIKVDYIYEDLNGNYGSSFYCFEKFNKKFCKANVYDVFEVKFFGKD